MTGRGAPPMTDAEVHDLPVTFPAWPTVARILRLQRTAFYEAIKEEDGLPIPVIRVGRQLIARKRDVLNFLGEPPEDEDAAGYQPAAPSTGHETPSTCK